MRRLMAGARQLADYVVIDSPPTSLMADAEVLAEYADVSLLVVRQGTAKTRDINDTIDMLENGSSKLLGCIYNDVKTGVFSGKKAWGDYGYGGYRRYGHGYGYGKYGSYGKSVKPQTEQSKPESVKPQAESPKQAASEPQIEIPDLVQGIKNHENIRG